jgi:hypothetical protein
MRARLLLAGVLLTLPACWGAEFTSRAEQLELMPPTAADAGDVDGAHVVAEGDAALAGDDAAAGLDAATSSPGDEDGPSSSLGDDAARGGGDAGAAGDVAVPPVPDAGGGPHACTSGPSSCPACGFGAPCCTASNLCGCAVSSVCR